MSRFKSLLDLFVNPPNISLTENPANLQSDNKGNEGTRVKSRRASANWHQSVSLSTKHCIGLVGFNKKGFVIARPVNFGAPWLRDRALTLRQHAGNKTNMTDGLRCGLNLMETMSRSTQRQFWLLSWNRPDLELGRLFHVVAACQEACIAINTVAIGHRADAALLREISSNSYGGDHFRVTTLRQLSPLLVKKGSEWPRGGKCRPSCAVMVIDCGYETGLDKTNLKRLSTVEEAVVDFIYSRKRIVHSAIARQPKPETQEVH